MNQQLFEKLLCNQINHYERYGQFPLRKEVITCYHQSDTFLLSVKMNGMHREDTGKSMKNALYVLWYVKDTSYAEVSKPVALAIVQLHWFEGIS